MRRPALLAAAVLAALAALALLWRNGQGPRGSAEGDAWVAPAPDAAPLHWPGGEL